MMVSGENEIYIGQGLPRMFKRRKCNLVLLAFLTGLVAGCAGGPAHRYPGPERPPEQLSLIDIPKGKRIERSKGWSSACARFRAIYVDDPNDPNSYPGEFYLLPGRHEIVVEKFLQTGTAGSTGTASDVFLIFVMLADYAACEAVHDAACLKFEGDLSPGRAYTVVEQDEETYRLIDTGTQEPTAAGEIVVRGKGCGQYRKRLRGELVWHEGLPGASPGAEPPSMATRDKVIAFIEEDRRGFEARLRTYRQKALCPASCQVGVTHLHSYEILQAGEERVILDIQWRDGLVNSRLGRMKFLLYWEGGELVFVAHKEP